MLMPFSYLVLRHIAVHLDVTVSTLKYPYSLCDLCKVQNQISGMWCSIAVDLRQGVDLVGTLERNLILLHEDRTEFLTLCSSSRT